MRDRVFLQPLLLQSLFLQPLFLQPQIPLYILAHGIAVLAIGDLGLGISDWVVGIGVVETGSGGWRLLECVFWVVHETRIRRG